MLIDTTIKTYFRLIKHSQRSVQLVKNNSQKQFFWEFKFIFWGLIQQLKFIIIVHCDLDTQVIEYINRAKKFKNLKILRSALEIYVFVNRNIKKKMRKNWKIMKFCWVDDYWINFQDIIKFYSFTLEVSLERFCDFCMSLLILYVYKHIFDILRSK